MSYVIVKGNKKLHGFHSNDAPIGDKRVYYIDRFTGDKDFRYEKVFSTKYMFTYYKDSYTRFRDYNEAKEYIEHMKKEILKNETRYEKFLEGSTQRLLNYVQKLKITEDDGVFNN